MNITKKTIVLNNLNGSEKAIIKLFNTSKTNFELKLPIPLKSAETDYYMLIKTEEDYIKLRLSNMPIITTNLTQLIDLDGKIAVLIVSINNNEQKPLFWGGTSCTCSQDCENIVLAETEQQNDSSRQKGEFCSAKSAQNSTTTQLDSNISLSLNHYDNSKNISQNKTIDNSKTSKLRLEDNIQNDNVNSNTFQDSSFNQSSENNSTHLFDYSINDIENEIDKNISKSETELNDISCNSCRYKQDFYHEAKMQEAKTVLEEISKNQNKTSSTASKEPEYYALIKSQYDEMFNRYPVFDTLAQIIPNSKWVNVELDKDPYVIGIIYENDTAKYLCYGVPQTQRTSPPAELTEYSQWLPYDPNNPYGAGIYLIYQSAENGETIKVEVV